ncbi:hypothetical protein C3920_10635 [Novacetimonas pomaceti]|uniref:Uncharacterized protein n=1 Tax=Novacetimonas pomaceti TaxID=2021998 RepID=A0ABX5P399_9PROT|nr:hypothetical protein C3920_10635 [Novacetimonas pomaceti]
MRRSFLTVGAPPPPARHDGVTGGDGRAVHDRIGPFAHDRKAGARPAWLPHPLFASGVAPYG